MPQEIQAIRLDIQDIGKHVKGSKKRFSWTFGLNGRHHTIILDFSFISGKVKLVVDRKTMLETEIPSGSSFQHPFTLDGYALNILQQGESFQLRINNKVFSHLYNQMKTNTEFKNYEDQVKDIKVNESNFSNNTKTVKLNIGAFDGAKKKKQAAQTSNWGDLGSAEMGIPSYFGDSPTKQQKKEVAKTKSLFDDFDQQDSSTQQSEKSSIQKSKKVEQVDFFGDMGQKQPVSKLKSPSSQHLQNILGQPQKTQQQQFNTMQNMFSTMNINQRAQSKPESGLDLLNSLTVQPTAPNFNTMQQKISAQNQAYNSNLGVNPTQAVNLGTDFNTLQNLFATGTQNPQISTTTPVTAHNYQTTGVSSNAYPMQNLYATGQLNQGYNLGQPTLQPITLNNPSALGQLPVQDNFNTMQNLFATNSNQVNSTAFPQNINIQDFNTMQNLFKTGSGAIVPPPPTTTITTTTTTITTNSKPEDAFGLLDLSQKNQNQNNSNLMFNTYSGPKTSGTAQIDMSAFGTMQKGQPVGNIDFLNLNQAKPQPQPQQVPNFSKKKEPVEDLI